MLPRCLSLRHIILGRAYSGWAKRDFGNYIKRMPDSEDKLMMTEMLRRIP